MCHTFLYCFCNSFWKEKCLQSYSAQVRFVCWLKFFLKYSQTELTLPWRRSLSYRNHSIDLLNKSMDWFLYDNDLRHERVKRTFNESIDTEELEHSQPERYWIYILLTWASHFKCINRNFSNRFRILNKRKYFMKGQSFSLLNVFLK